MPPKHRIEPSPQAIFNRLRNFVAYRVRETKRAEANAQIRIGKPLSKMHRIDRGRDKTQVLADFFIGAQAAVESCPVLTRDPRRYTAYFPTVRLITPQG